MLVASSRCPWTPQPQTDPSRPSSDRHKLGSGDDIPSISIITDSPVEIIIISHVHDQHTHAFTDLKLLPILKTVISRQFPI